MWYSTLVSRILTGLPCTKIHTAIISTLYSHFIEVWLTYQKLPIFYVYNWINLVISIFLWNHHFSQHHKHIGKDFLDIVPKAQVIKAKIDKWHYTKLKASVKTKNNNQQNEKQLMSWEKMFIKNILDKGLIFKIHKKYNSIETKQSK